MAPSTLCWSTAAPRSTVAPADPIASGARHRSAGDGSHASRPGTTTCDLPPQRGRPLCVHPPRYGRIRADTLGTRSGRHVRSARMAELAALSDDNSWAADPKNSARTEMSASCDPIGAHTGGAQLRIRECHYLRHRHASMLQHSGRTLRIRRSQGTSPLAGPRRCAVLRRPVSPGGCPAPRHPRVDVPMEGSSTTVRNGSAAPPCRRRTP